MTTRLWLLNLKKRERERERAENNTRTSVVRSFKWGSIGAICKTAQMFHFRYMNQLPFGGPMCLCPRSILTGIAEQRWQEEGTGKPVWFRRQRISVAFWHRTQLARETKALPPYSSKSPSGSHNALLPWPLRNLQGAKVVKRHELSRDPGFREGWANTDLVSWMFTFQSRRKCLQTPGHQLIAHCHLEKKMSMSY